MKSWGGGANSRRPITVGLLLFLSLGSALAQSYRIPEIESRSAVVMDAATGHIIYDKNGGELIPPASMTKLMTMYLVFQEIQAGRASLQEIIEPPPESWARNQLPLSSLMGLAPGQRLSIRELLLGMAIHSGNDAAAALALRFAPSVASFVDRMNQTAAAMGLEHTFFVDPSGYSELNQTTAQEFAYFCRHYLTEYPRSLEDFHSVLEYAYPLAQHVAEPYRDAPETRVQRNRNSLLGQVQGVDGLKTGSIPAAGFNIALTAERGGTRFIAVLMGAPSSPGGDRIRDEDGRRLLEWAFDEYKTLRPPLPFLEPPRVWKGRQNSTRLIFREEPVFTVPLERGEDLLWVLDLEGPIIAPLGAFSPVGDLILYDSIGELARFRLLTAEDLERGGFFKRLFDSIRLFFQR
ncbi:MAG: D-alanyl-D-alanine carboxypeptidase [Treponema sp.]|nr:D-alanyl-D-alanine carboxypeptidase [Treponema sp.]